VRDHLEALIRGHDPLRTRNVVREYLQARALRAMQGAGALTALAFQGGTCLRFLYSLPRYSEDHAKGRDLYDLIWYLSDPDWPAPNLSLLNAALQQSGWKGDELTHRSWTEPVAERLAELHWEQALADVRPFLEEQDDIDLINRDDALRLLARSSSAR